MLHRLSCYFILSSLNIGNYSSQWLHQKLNWVIVNTQALNFAGLPLHYDLLKVEPTDMPYMALVNSQPECWCIVDGARWILWLLLIVHYETWIFCRYCQITARGGHLYFRLDIIRVKGFSKHTLNTYFSGMKIDPKYAFLLAFFLILASRPFKNLSIWPKTYPFFQFCTFLHP